MGAAGSVELHALQFEIGCMGIWSTYVGSVHVRKDALWSPKEYWGCRASAARNHPRTTKGVFQGSVRGKLAFCLSHSRSCVVSCIESRVYGFKFQVMRKCWAHSPEVRPSFRVLKEQLISVSQGLINDWLNLLRCMRLSSPSYRSIRSTTKSSPSSERSPSTSLPSSNLPYNSATLPSRKTRAPASPPPSTIDFPRRFSSTTCKSKREGSSSPSTPGHQASQQKPSSSSTNNVCDVCSSYGHPWIEICKAIRATKGKWVKRVCVRLRVYV